MNEQQLKRWQRIDRIAALVVALAAIFGLYPYLNKHLTAEPEPHDPIHAPAPSTLLAHPYHFILHFDDGSRADCQATGFSINFLTVDVNGIASCLPDDIFKNGFE